MDIFNEDKPRARTIPKLYDTAKGIPDAHPSVIRAQIRSRLRVVGFLIVVAFVLVYAQTFYLQVIATEQYQTKVAKISEKRIVIPAPRGNIMDANGVPIVSSRYAQVVSVRPDELPKDQRARIIRELAIILSVDEPTILKKIDTKAFAPYQRRPIAIDVNPNIVFWLHANSATRFPGVYTERIMMREYPQGSLGAHIVGYTGEISQEQLDDGKHKNYKAGDQIGLAGVERTWEHALHGQDGERRVSVNAKGVVQSNVDIVRPAIQGSNVLLTIDSGLQKATEHALEQGIAYARTVEDHETDIGRGGTYAAVAGAVVVLEAKTGAIAAMASYPSYNPGAFVGGISSKEWDHLQDPASNKPLINRAIQSGYPPGSIYKVVTSAAALHDGFVESDSYIPCPAKWEWNNSVYRNWRKSDAGSLSIPESLEQSCDTVYYELARRMYLREANTPQGKAYIDFAKKTPGPNMDVSKMPLPTEILPTMSRQFGLGAKTGVDLPGEIPGIVPGRQWRMQYWLDARTNYCTRAKEADAGSYSQNLYQDLCSFGFRWRGGDSVNMSTGQGDLQVTPLQMASVFAAVANKGPIYTPHIVGQVQAADGAMTPVVPTVLHQTGVYPSDLHLIEEGLIRVTRGAQGTAKRYFKGLPFEVAGKTGTAEHKPKQPYAWFAGYNVQPVNDKQYVIVAMIEEGGGGSSTAAPIVDSIFTYLAHPKETR